MEILIKSIQASKVIDVGVFTGLSALTFAFAVPDDGKVYALDISEEFTSVGR